MANGLLAMMAGAMIFSFILFIGMYVFMSLVYMAIAKKNNQSSPGLAWIPGIGPIIVIVKASGMKWWPYLLILLPVLMPIFAFKLSLLAIFGVITWLAMLFVGVYSIILHWKTFEAIGRPGWWAIMLLVPIVNIVFLCMAAWGQPQTN